MFSHTLTLIPLGNKAAKQINRDNMLSEDLKIKRIKALNEANATSREIADALKEKLADGKRSKENERLMGLAEFFCAIGNMEESMKHVQQAIDLASSYKNQAKENHSTPQIVSTGFDGGDNDKDDSDIKVSNVLVPVMLHTDHLDGDSNSNCANNVGAKECLCCL